MCLFICCLKAQLDKIGVFQRLSEKPLDTLCFLFPSAVGAIHDRETTSRIVFHLLSEHTCCLKNIPTHSALTCCLEKTPVPEKRVFDIIFCMLPEHASRQILFCSICRLINKSLSSVIVTCHIVTCHPGWTVSYTHLTLPTNREV